MRRVIVLPYDPAWVSVFATEARHLLALLARPDWQVHHIGSTSVPGLAAKPVIDCLLEVDSHVHLDARTPRLEADGYVAMGEYGLPGRRYFRKDAPDGTRYCHVHAYESGNPEIHRHVRFRDYLRENPIRARAYGELKLRLAEEHPQDIEAYMDGKDPLIKELEAEAGL